MNEKKNSHKPQASQDAVWRPIESIRPKVIGIAKKKECLLVYEVLSDRGELKGWCQLGGGIKFGETGESALKREIYEELGCGIIISGNLMICENIFEHHAAKGHEIILAFPITFDDPKIYAKQRFQICESRGSVDWVEWVKIKLFRAGKEILFPPALVEQILLN